jgi:hypothetical protein
VFHRISGLDSQKAGTRPCLQIKDLARNVLQDVNVTDSERFHGGPLTGQRADLPPGFALAQAAPLKRAGMAA